MLLTAQVATQACRKYGHLLRTFPSRLGANLSHIVTHICADQNYTVTNYRLLAHLQATVSTVAWGSDQDLAALKFFAGN